MRTSQRNVEAFARGIEAYNRGDVDALLDELAPGVEWRPSLPVLLGGELTVYRGHDGVRRMMSELDEVIPERHLEFSDIQAADDRVVAIGSLRTRGRGSGVAIESRFGWVADFKDGKTTRIRTYLDPDEALEAGRAD